MKQRLIFIVWLSLLTVCQGRPMSAQPEDPCKPPNYPTPTFRTATYNVRDFGAVGDGITNDTSAINRAIEKCSSEGGGDIVFTEGKYLAASIHLRSNIRFVVQPRAVISGAGSGFDEPERNLNDQYQDFGHSHFHNALMWGEKIENFTITGGGQVNGGLIHTGIPKQKDLGDKVIALVSSRNIHFENITHKNGGHFVYLLNDCENITFRNITIRRSRDAIDLMGCRNVQITGCTFTGCGDDTLGIKSDWALGRKIETRNIYAWDCTFESGCNALQFGSETAGDFYNVNIWNIRITKSRKAGIGITSNDGGIIDGVTYRDITMTGVTEPIFMIITDRLRTGDPAKRVGVIRDVRISNVVVTDCRPGEGPVDPITLSGKPDAIMENIIMENIKVTYPGGGHREWSDLVPPYPQEYQPWRMGNRPASGLYARHIRGLTLRNVAFSFTDEDQRPPLVLFDIDGLVLDGFQSKKPAGVDTLRIQQVRQAIISRSVGLADRKGATIEKASE